VTPFACKLLPEQGFGFRKANVIEFHVFASHFPSDEVQNEAEVRGTRIQTQMAQKPVLREEVGMRERCANTASAEWFRRERGIGQIPRKICKSEVFVGVAHSQNNKEEGARARELVTCGTRGPLGRGQSVPFRGSTPVSANDWGNNTTAVAVLIKFVLYWASLILLRAVQLRVELPCKIVVLFVESFLPFSRVATGIVDVLS